MSKHPDHSRADVRPAYALPSNLDLKARRELEGLFVQDDEGQIYICAQINTNTYRWIEMQQGNRWDDSTEPPNGAFPINVTIIGEMLGESDWIDTNNLNGFAPLSDEQED